LQGLGRGGTCVLSVHGDLIESRPIGSLELTRNKFLASWPELHNSPATSVKFDQEAFLSTRLSGIADRK